jgi:SP family galactose:H+ symporter-like MFS transporter
MFLTVTLFAAMMFFGGFILPESPRWLMLKGRKEQAIAVLQRTMNTQQEIDAEIAGIEHALHGPQGAGIGIVLRGYFFKVLVVGVLLQMFQQLVGINMMIYYSPTIFGYAGITGLLAGMTVPTVNMLFTFPAIHLVEKWGRKKLLYVGAVAMLVTMVAAGAAFQSIAANPAMISGAAKAVLLVSAVVYIFGFAVSCEVGMTITTMVNWTFAGLVMGNALSFMKAYGNASIFYMFGGFCVLAIVFVAMFVPETKGITLEKMEFNLKNGVPLRLLGERPDAPTMSVPNEAGASRM